MTTTHQDTNDCAVTALATITGLSKSTVALACERAGRIYQHGTPLSIIRQAIHDLGCDITHQWSPSTLKAATGTTARPTTHSFISHSAAFRRLPNMLVITPNHIAAVTAGILRDWSQHEAQPILEAWEVTPAHHRPPPHDIIYLGQCQ